MDAETVSAELNEGILVLTLRRGSKLNALNLKLTKSLLDAFERAEADDVRVVVLLGEGRSFCTGDDVQYLLSSPEGLSDELPELLGMLADILEKISSLPKPVIAGVQGYAVGGGAELALEADLRVVGEDVHLAFPDVEIGSTPATLYPLVRQVGRALATEMVLTGRALVSTELKDLGIAARVVEPGQVRDESIALAESVRDTASMSVLGIAKRALARADQLSRRAELDENLTAMLQCVGESRADEHAKGILRR